MQNDSTDRASVSWTRWLLLGLVAVLVLAPWWRNHRYLRDFYDYGLVMSGVGRIAAGERPYVDFVTPIQTGTFLFNGWAEQLGDGTYQAMTRGAAALTLAGVVLLAGIFSRRWSGGAAVALAGALVAMTASQHTIIWHNVVGALCLAVAGCSAALAPVLRRAHWPWHLLTAVALGLGGLNKLNAHLVALCGVLAWALHAGFLRRATWPRVLATLVFALGCGVLLPVAVELAWTGASLGTWWYDVVALPFTSRSGDFAAALEWRFYFTTRHGYYGALPLPALGALGVLVTAVFAVAGVRTLGWRQGAWGIAAAGFVVVAGAGLLATNYEIAYVALGAWFALVAALWLGFALPGTGRWFYGGLVLPALGVGALAWMSAWQGQRSQFGYSQAARAEYKPGESIGPDFGYLRGTFVPPETARSMQAMAAWRSGLPAKQRAAVFYGPGLEWLERPWPALKLPGMPLWMHGGTSYGAKEEHRLLQVLSAGGPYQNILVPEARDFWGPALTLELTGKRALRRMGPVWFRYEKLPVGIASGRPLEFLQAFGGNANSTQLVSFMTLRTLADGRAFLGVDQGAGEMRLVAPSYRAQAEAVLQRVPGKTAGPPVAVRFEVFSLVNGAEYLRWSAAVISPADQPELIVPFPLDCGGSPLRFHVTVPPELSGQVAAGWRALRLLHSVDGPDAPLRLHPEAAEARLADAAARRALLPEGWSPPAVYLRDGRVGKDGMELRPGGEIWIRLSGAYREIHGTTAVVAGTNLPDEPVVRVFYAKGAKLDVLAQSVVGRANNYRYEFNAWSPEPDGWLVIAVDPGARVPPVSVRLPAVKAAD